MPYNFFLLPFLLSFGFGIILLVFFIWLNSAGKNKADARTAARHIHALGTSRLGGIAIIISFIAALLFDGRLVFSAQLIAVLVGTLAILLMGLMDDFRQLSWKSQLAWQLAIGLAAFSLNLRLEFITNPLGGVFLLNGGWGYAAGLVIVIVWMIFLMNSMNWLDGIDGASSGVALIAVATIFLLSLRPEVNQPPVGIITAALMGCLGAFLLLNFYPAKIMAGTTGSMFMGFILAVLALFAGAKIATTLLVLAIPIIDALWVIGERIRNKQSIFLSDRRHLHYRLLEIGWSQTQICLVYYGLTALIALAALNTTAKGKIISFLIVLVVMLAIFSFIYKIQRADEK